MEAVISTFVVAVLFTAALNAAGQAAVGRSKVVWQAQGQQLASALMSEILVMDYRDPASPTVVLGCEVGEVASDRSTFDDVDDFNKYEQTPPKSQAGVTLSPDANWTWNVKIEWVRTSSPGGGADFIETGAKRVTVIVSRRGLTVATLVALQTNVQ